MPANPWAILQAPQPVDLVTPFLQARQQRQQQQDADQVRQMRQQEIDLRTRAMQQQQQQQELAAKEDAFIDQLMKSSLKQDPETGMWTYDRSALQKGFAEGGMTERWPTYSKLIDESDNAIANMRQAKLAALARMAAVVEATGNNPTVFRNEAQRGVQNGLYTEQDLAPFMEAAQSPEGVARITAALQGKKAAEPVKLGPGDVLVPPTGGAPIASNPRPETPPPGFNLSPGQTRFDGSGKPIASLPPTEKSDAPTPTAALEGTLKLRDRFVRETQAAQTVKTQYDMMRSSLDAVKKGSLAAGSQGVLITFNKILDPTSVVRESEYARSASGQSLLNRMEGAWQTIQKGGAGVPASELEKFVQLAEQFVKNQAAAASETKRQIDAIAKQFKLDPSTITRDIGGDSAPDPLGIRGPK